MPKPTARCAACRIPIVGGQFAIDREFAFHPGCVGRPVLVEKELATAREVAAQNAGVITDMSTKRSELRVRAEKAETEARTTRLAYDSVKAELEATRARIELLERELRAAAADLAAARVEKVTAPDKSDAGSDLRDASSIRFGLLELK